jgi:hypothetical protein
LGALIDDFIFDLLIFAVRVGRAKSRMTWISVMVSLNIFSAWALNDIT